MNWNELMSKNHEKVCATLNYKQHFLILGSTITGYVSISAFTSLVAILTGITSSEFGLKICAVTEVFKKYKSIMKKHNKILLLAKAKPNT